MLKNQKNITIRISELQKNKIKYVLDRKNKGVSDFLRDCIQNEIELFEKNNGNINIE